MTPAAIRTRLRGLAAEAGFDDCRVAAAAKAPHGEAFRRWLADGCQGTMGWMARDPERRADPRLVLPGCRSVVALALNYYPGPRPPGPAQPSGRIARYAWGDDYHDLILPRLRALAAALEELGGTQKCYTDTGPVLERDFASRAGLGWNGKSTLQIHPALGTWFFLGVILTTLQVEPDEPARDRCGRCARCLAACPTGAITAPHQLDARRCLSYLTIEHKGPIPVAMRPLVGDRIYGCDDCLEACPWNRFARVAREAAFHARPAIFALGLRGLLGLDDAAFQSLFHGSPIRRLKHPRFQRNVCVALGNAGTPDDLPALRHAAAAPDPLVAEHAEWAVATIARRGTGPAGSAS